MLFRGWYWEEIGGDSQGEKPGSGAVFGGSLVALPHHCSPQPSSMQLEALCMSLPPQPQTQELEI